jgi:predicted AlkP superfamily pyrophosphatase or phosphodiesterase
MRRTALGLSFAVIGAAACGGGTPPQVAQPAAPDASVQTANIGDGGTRDAAAPKPRPSKVVVAIVVDQLSAWAALERIPELPKNGGFARLVAEGTWVEELRYLHATTDTAPGHAALFTGATPRDSGIFGNEVIEEATGKRVSILRDPEAPLRFGGTGHGSSLARLRVDTVADRLRAADPQAVIVSLSLKDRGALFGAGRSPDLALWYDSKTGHFVGSTAMTKEAKERLAAVLAPQGELVALEEDQAWAPLDAAWVGKHARVPDAQPGEGDLLGLGTTFPHPAPKATKWAPITARATPAGDRALVRLAVAALPTATTDHPFLLAVSFSSHDYVGHVFGPDSWEALDELYRLDAQLAALFTALDVQFGADGWSAMLTGDHGATPLPETPLDAREWCKPGAKDRFERPCAPGDRLLMDATAKELEAAATAALGPGPWIAGVADPWVYPTRKAIALPTDKRARLDHTVEQVLVTKHPRAVHRVLRFSTLADACPPGESEAALLCNSAPSGQEDAWYVVTRPGSFFDPDYTEGHGSSHGSDHLFDRAVPLLVRGGGVPAGRVVKEPVEFRAYARTLSSLLGIEAPVAARWGVDLTAKR